MFCFFFNGRVDEYGKLFFSSDNLWKVLNISAPRPFRTPKNWCLWTAVLEKTLESPLHSKEIKPVYLQGNQPWILIGWTDAEVETPVFRSSDSNSWLIGKVPGSGKDWGQKEKRASENEMAGWHHRCNGHDFGRWWGTGRPGCSCLWGRRVRHDWATEQRQWYPLSQETGDVIHNTVVFLYCSSLHLHSWEYSIHSLPLNWELSSCSQEDGDWAWFCWPVSLPCVLADPRFFSSLTGRQRLFWDFSLSTFSLPQLQCLCL